MHARLFSAVYLCTGINLISYIPSIGLLVYYIQSKLQFVTLDNKHWNWFVIVSEI